MAIGFRNSPKRTIFDVWCSDPFYIDLVFYNYLLKCFVLFDLKSGELTHQDIGQMDMYVRITDDLKRAPDDNPTVGIILCTDKDASVVRYSMLHENEQIFRKQVQTCPSFGRGAEGGI